MQAFFLHHLGKMPGDCRSRVNDCNSLTCNLFYHIRKKRIMGAAEDNDIGACIKKGLKAG